ncbi:MAG: protein kinase [Bacteroidales bacterium]|nr:protein kinase [Bacteroidales bacterium]
MNESGPIKRPNKTQGDTNHCDDLQQIAPNAWKVRMDGKYWLLKTARSGDTASWQLLRREYDLARELQHPFISSAFSFWEESPVGPAILMEYVDGVTLRTFAASQPSPPLRKKVLAQVLDAIEYLHRKGMLHNDIKPENILVTAIGNDVKIIDFGYAEKDADYLNKRLGGTVGASAPEVFEGADGTSSTAAADIYSLGGIIQLLFPRRYRPIVNKCRKENPRDRYPDVASLRRAIARRNRRPFLFAAAAIILCLIGIAMIPNLVREQKLQEKEEVTLSRVDQIREDLTVFYQQAADTLEDRSIVPYMEFAYPIRNHFVEQYVEYRNRIPEQEMLPVCDSVYASLITRLSETMLEIPRFEDLHTQGLMSDKENSFYLDLVIHDKPYTPYVK